MGIFWGKYTLVTICLCLQSQQVITKSYQILSYIIPKVLNEFVVYEWVSTWLTPHVSIDFWVRFFVIGERFFQTFILLRYRFFSPKAAVSACQSVEQLFSYYTYVRLFDPCYVLTVVLVNRPRSTRKNSLFLQSESQTTWGLTVLL